jgi:hypothetical protein
VSSTASQTHKAFAIEAAIGHPAASLEEPNPNVPAVTQDELGDDESLNGDDTAALAESPIKIIDCADSGDFLPSNIDPQAVNDFFDKPDISPGQLEFDEILKHRHVEGQLDLRVRYKDASHSWVPFSLLSHDEPLILAKH